MTDHGKKKIAPIVITIVMVLYYAFYFGILVVSLPTIGKIALGVIPLLLAIASIYVCVQRMREIDGGEEDDLGDY